VKRVRWLSAKWPIGLRTLATKMKEQPFREDGHNGFIIDRVRDNSVNGRYVEKFSYQYTLTTPFGEQQFFDRTEYRQLEFNLFTTFPQVEFLDPPRSTQGFLSKLGELNKFSVAVVPLATDLLRWVDSFQKVLEVTAVIDSLQISGFEPEPGVTARISIGGRRDVRDALKRLTKGKPFDLERVQVRIPYEGRMTPLHLIHTGAVKLEDDVFDDLLSPLRQSIAIYE
jgi:hypothetical protein